MPNQGWRDREDIRSEADRRAALAQLAEATDDDDRAPCLSDCAIELERVNGMLDAERAAHDETRAILASVKQEREVEAIGLEVERLKLELNEVKRSHVTVSTEFCAAKSVYESVIRMMWRWK